MFGHNSEPVQLYRDCPAVLIPAGDEVILRKGANGFITQSLGGSFTVYLDGSLFRISGENADALGKERVLPPSLPPDASHADVEQLVWEQLKTCYDPEIPINIVDLGLIYRCQLHPADSGFRVEQHKRRDNDEEQNCWIDHRYHYQLIFCLFKNVLHG